LAALISSARTGLEVRQPYNYENIWPFNHPLRTIARETLSRNVKDFKVLGTRPKTPVSTGTLVNDKKMLAMLASVNLPSSNTM
jgi:hypothetical protein